MWDSSKRRKTNKYYSHKGQVIKTVPGTAKRPLKISMKDLPKYQQFFDQNGYSLIPRSEAQDNLYDPGSETVDYESFKFSLNPVISQTFFPYPTIYYTLSAPDEYIALDVDAAQMSKEPLPFSENPSAGVLGQYLFARDQPPIENWQITSIPDQIPTDRFINSGWNDYIITFEPTTTENNIYIIVYYYFYSQLDNRFTIYRFKGNSTTVQFSSKILFLAALWLQSLTEQWPVLAMTNHTFYYKLDGTMEGTPGYQVFPCFYFIQIPASQVNTVLNSNTLITFRTTNLNYSATNPQNQFVVASNGWQTIGEQYITALKQEFEADPKLTEGLSIDKIDIDYVLYDFPSST